MFRFSNNYSYNLYDEIKNIVNEILDEEASENQIEELTRSVSLLFKEYTRQLIRQSIFSDQNSLINIYQPNFNYSPFNQAILPFQSTPKRKSKPHKQKNKSLDENQNSNRTQKFESHTNSPISDNYEQKLISDKPKKSLKSTHFTQNEQQNQNNSNENVGYQSNPSNNKEQTQQLLRKEKNEAYTKYIFNIINQMNSNNSNKNGLKNNSFITEIFERITNESSK